MLQRCRTLGPLACGNDVLQCVSLENLPTNFIDVKHEFIAVAQQVHPEDELMKMRDVLLMQVIQDKMKDLHFLT